MKLIIAEYLRTLKERDELDRLLPDLIIEMGYTPVARPQTGNRQDGVDIAARGKNNDGEDELLLLVVKRGDIGRKEWDSGPDSVRQSLNDIFDVYLKSYLEPQDSKRKIHIVLVTNGELKQTAQRNWSGYVNDQQDKALIEFWGVDTISRYVEEYLLDEHIFHDEDRQDLRRALALSGDSEYNRNDLHRIFLRALDLDTNGHLKEKPKTGKSLLKSMRIVNLSAKIFANWTLVKGGDSRQGLFALERALLWSWHRIQLIEPDENSVIGSFDSLWNSYIGFILDYYERLKPYYFTRSSMNRAHVRNGAEASIIAFEQIGIIASFTLFMVLHPARSEQEKERLFSNAIALGNALASFIENNGICTSPCFDSHSQDITLALMALVITGKQEEAEKWLRRLFRNVSYSFASKTYIPIAVESLEDLPEEGGWLGDVASKRMMGMSWTLPTIAGWCVIFDKKELYAALQTGVTEEYIDTCLQLWHPESDFFQHLYYHTAHYESGVTQAPIELPPDFEDYKKQMMLILDSDIGKVMSNSSAYKFGLSGLDFIAFRHFSTPVPPVIWYQILTTQSRQPVVNGASSEVES